MKLHFIGGIWRSGTSLLREVLGMSEAVHTFPEHSVLLSNLEMINEFSARSKQKLISQSIENPDFVHFAQPDQSFLKSGVEQSKSFKEAITAMYTSCINNNQVDTLIDKNPIYSYYVEELLSHFTESKFIWLIREPKDNCISRAKHSIQSFKNYSYLAQWWNYTNAVLAQAKLKFPDRILLLPYDLMVVEPEKWVTKICDFFEIDFQPAMLSFETRKDERIERFKKGALAKHGTIDPKYANQKAAMWENLQKPINTSKTKQWKRELNEDQISKIDYYTQAYYNDLLSGSFHTNYPKHFIYHSLMKASLYKLKSSIANGTFMAK